MTVLIILIAPLAGRFTDQIGPRWLMGAGTTLLSGSLLLFATLDQHSSFWNILPGLLVGGFGMAITMSPTTTAAMGSVPVDQAGVGSAVINTMRQVGGSLGVAIMGALVASSVSLDQSDPRFGLQFVDGYHRALYAGAAMLFAGAIVAVLTVRKPHHADPQLLAQSATAASGRFEDAA
jgi:MFS family permease